MQRGATADHVGTAGARAVPHLRPRARRSRSRRPGRPVLPGVRRAAQRRHRPHRDRSRERWPGSATGAGCTRATRTRWRSASDGHRGRVRRAGRGRVRRRVERRPSRAGLAGGRPAPRSMRCSTPARRRDLGADPRRGGGRGRGEGDRRAAATTPGAAHRRARWWPRWSRAAQTDGGWVGDSRAYWLGPPGGAAQSSLLTTDHSWAVEIVALGELDEAAAAADPRAHAITRWLGADASDAPSVVELRPAEPGLLLLCSDGLWNYLPDADALASAAYAAGPEPRGHGRRAHAVRAGLPAAATTSPSSWYLSPCERAPEREGAEHDRLRRSRDSPSRST